MCNSSGALFVIPFNGNGKQSASVTNIIVGEKMLNTIIDREKSGFFIFGAPQRY